MQTTLDLHSKPHFRNLWRNPRNHHFHRLQSPNRNPKTKNLKIPRKITACYLKIFPDHQSRNHKKQEQEQEQEGVSSSSNSSLLPVIVRRAGRVSQYFYDGDRLGMVCIDQEDLNFIWGPFGFDGFRRLLKSWIKMSRTAVRNLFIPQQVQGNYISYLRWKFLHRIFSSALQVLATQAMLRAIGIGAHRSLSSAAALNWALKDGLGRLSRCVFTARLGSTFDTNLKRVRFSTSVLFSLSIGVELLTPCFPQYFLLLATIANVGKSISWAAYLGTGSAIHRSFAIADNLGEVSAKAQIQTVCFDNLGLMLATILNIMFKNNQRLLAALPLAVYPIFSTVDLFAIYQALKHVHLQTLTKDRLEIIIETWIHSGNLPSIAEVSNKEDISFLGRKGFGSGSKRWPIRIGCVDPKEPSPKLSALMMRSLRGKDLYFISMETSYKGLMREKQQGILLSLHERAGTADIIMGLLQSCYLRKELLQNKMGVLLTWNGKPPKLGSPESVIERWLEMVEDSRSYAEREISMLIQEMRISGWAMKNVLLNAQEQVRYSFAEESS